MVKPARRAKAPVLQLIRPARSDDTIAALGDLLADAALGGIVGLAYIALRPEGHYSAGIAGKPEKNKPLWATNVRGMLRVLDEELGDLVRGG